MTIKNAKTIQEALMYIGASDLNTDLLQIVSLEDLLAMNMDRENPRLAFRTAWAVEHILLKHTDLLAQVYPTMLSQYNQLENWSCLRSYTKLIMWMLGKENKRISLTESELESILDKTFSIVEDPECPVAVLVNGLDILFLLSVEMKWLRTELRMLVEFHLEKEATPALKSRGSMLLKKLTKLN